MYQIDFNHPVHVHFVGIGGISMSGLAQILASEGFTVSGSDRAASEITRTLENSGIRVMIGQRRENITKDIDLAVFTAAIHPDNPEYKAVQEMKIPALTRAELLGQLMRNYRLPVAVSGTHGKTTTTSMLSEILLAAGTDPTLSIGGVLPSIGGNVRVGGGTYFVAEACEYTNSFLQMYPLLGIILNIEEDHLDFFKDLDDIRHSFHRFARLIPGGGALVINTQIENWQEITEDLSCEVVTFSGAVQEDAGTPAAQYYPSDIHFDGLGHPSFTLHGPAQYGEPAQIRLHVPGLHNVGNAIAAVAAADRMGISGPQARRGSPLSEEPTGASSTRGPGTDLRSSTITPITRQRSRRPCTRHRPVPTRGSSAFSSPTPIHAPNRSCTDLPAPSPWRIPSFWRIFMPPERLTPSASAP